MDLDRIAMIASVDGKGREVAFNFTLQIGALSSALEHAIPEQMFVTPESPGEAVSAVKALAKATQLGQRMYHVTEANQAQVLPNIHQDGLIIEEIQKAVAVGKEVIIHADPISVPGWIGAGYVVYDPEIGDGAWKIGGGTNGGWYTLVAAGASAIWGLLSIAPNLVVTLVPFYLLLTLLAVTLLTVAVAYSEGIDYKTYSSQIGYMGDVVVGTQIFAALARVALALGAVGFAWGVILPTLVILLVVGAIIKLFPATGANQGWRRKQWTYA